MIPIEQAEKIIAESKLPKFRTSSLATLSSKYITLGKILTGNLTRTDDGYYGYNDEYALEMYKLNFGNDPKFNPWKSSQGKSLAAKLYGPNIGIHIADLWDEMNLGPYQNDYYKRPFRSKPSDTYTTKKLSFLYDLFNRGEIFPYKLPLDEIIRYSVYQEFSTGILSRVIGIALKKGDKVLFDRISNILDGEDEIGGVCSDLIEGLILSDRKDAWEMVAKLLLAAQRQEGLRQTIIANLKEASPKALAYFMKVILDNDLQRFSSVIMEIDEWFGFHWEAPKKATVKRCLELALNFMLSQKDAIKALQSNDNLEVYIALWSMGILNVDEANLKAIDLIQNASREKKIIACYFMQRTGRTNTVLLDWMVENIGKDLELDYLIVQLIPKSSWKQELVGQLIDIATSVPKAGKQVTGSGFSWIDYKIKSDYFYQIAVQHANDKQLEEMSAELASIPSEVRESYIRKIFPDHNVWSLRYANDRKFKSIHIPSNTWKKKLVWQALKDRNETVRSTAFNVLYHLTRVEEEDLDVLIGLLTRKGKDVRRDTLNLMLKQGDSSIKYCSTALLESGNINQRMGGLEILTQLKSANKMSSYVEQQAIAYIDTHKNFGENEQIYLDKLVVKKKSNKNFANGYGVIDYANLSPLITISDPFKSKKPGLFGKLMESFNPAFLFGELIDSKKIKKEVNGLIDLIEKHKNHEYTYEGWDGSTETTLIGDGFHLRHNKIENLEPEEVFELLPLPEVWQEWYRNSKLNDFELSMAIHYINEMHSGSDQRKYYRTLLSRFVPTISGLKIPARNAYYWNSLKNRVDSLLTFVYNAFADHNTMARFNVDLLESAIAHADDRLKRTTIEYGWDNEKMSWAVFLESNLPTSPSGLTEIKNDLPKLKRYWDLKRYLYFVDQRHRKKLLNVNEMAVRRPQSSYYHGSEQMPPSWVTLALHKEGLISDDDLLYQALIDDSVLNEFEGRANRSEATLTLHQKNLYEPLKKDMARY